MSACINIWLHDGVDQVRMSARKTSKVSDQEDIGYSVAIQSIQCLTSVAVIFRLTDRHMMVILASKVVL